MQLALNFPQERGQCFYTWEGYQPGPCWDLLLDLQDKMLDKIPFSESESQIWQDHQFSPKGYKYDTKGNLFKL